jgi:DNA-binding response OmpR family regulator
MKILLAEDDANIAVIVKLTLETVGGHQVTHASDGEIALALATQEAFDLILLDEMMPKLNGHKVCLEYNKRAEIPAPVIIMSANPQNPETLKTIGATSSITKPFEPMKLNAQLQAILNSPKLKTG